MSEVESLLRRVQAAEDKLEGIQDRIDRLESTGVETTLGGEKMIPTTLREYIWFMHHCDIVWTPSNKEEEPPF